MIIPPARLDHQLFCKRQAKRENARSPAQEGKAAHKRSYEERDENGEEKATGFEGIRGKAREQIKVKKKLGLTRGKADQSTPMMRLEA